MARASHPLDPRIPLTPSPTSIARACIPIDVALFAARPTYVPFVIGILYLIFDSDTSQNANHDIQYG